MPIVLPYVLPMFGAAFLGVLLAISAWRRRSTPGTIYFIPLIVAVAVWTAAAGLETAGTTLGSQLFWASFQYFGIVAVGPLWLLFILHYTGLLGRPRWYQVALLFAVPVATLALVWTNPEHGLIWRQVRLATAGPFPDLVVERGAWFWGVHTPYSWALIFLGILLLVRDFFRASGLRRGQVLVLLGASTIPLATNLLYLTGGSPLPYVDPTPLSFAAAGLLLAWGLYSYRLFDLAPIAFEIVVRSIGESVIVVDPANRIVEINPTAEKRLGRKRKEIIGRHVSEIFGQWSELINRYLDTRETDTRVVVDTRDGVRDYELRIFPIHDDRGRFAGRVVVSEDVSERKAYERRIEHMAYNDPLTGLPNRHSLHASAERAFAHAQRRNWEVAILFLDLDDFKAVNDALGHAAGDALLQLVAARLQGAVRQEDLLARLGGDEFAVLLQDCSHTSAERSGRRLLDTLTSPFDVRGTSLYVEASLGVAVYPADGGSVDELLARADVAMYQAKRARTRIEFYDAARHAFQHHRLQLETDLRRALAGDELVLEYQPVQDLRSGEVTMVEALVRWQHPEEGLLAPDLFLELAEERRIAPLVDRYVLRRALTEVGSLGPGVAVNLSSSSLLDEDLVDFVRETLAEVGVAPERLTLEISETALLVPERAGPLFERLRELGVKIATDDFGTGYSSLAYLRQFSLDFLKLDRHLVRGVGSRPGDEAIIRAVLIIAETMGLGVVAEGVETVAQLDWLRRQGCHLAQGYLIGHPGPAAELRAWLGAAPTARTAGTAGGEGAPSQAAPSANPSAAARHPATNPAGR